MLSTVRKLRAAHQTGLKVELGPAEIFAILQIIVFLIKLVVKLRSKRGRLVPPAISGIEAELTEPLTGPAFTGYAPDA